jgi:LTXXQ motif family protein
MSRLMCVLSAIALVASVSVAVVGQASSAQKGGAPAKGPSPAGHGGAPHMGGAHFSAPHATPHFSARPSFSGAHSFSHPTSHSNARAFSHSSFRGNIARSSSHPVFRGAHQTNVTRTLSRPTFRGNMVHEERRNADLNRRTLESSRAIHNALNTRSVRTALHDPRALHNPHTRTSIIASAARAGWHHHARDFDHAWWRHRHGGFGWVGPLFWPFAYYDFYDYALWGYGYDDSFWDYGYNDIYAGMFAPYDYDDLAGYVPQYAYAGPSRSLRGPRSPAANQNQLAEMCGDDSRDIAGLPVDQIQQTLQLTGEERAALDDLGNASAKAAQIIRAACPSDIALTAPARLAAMQARLQAMGQAVHVVQQPLAQFYGLLNDEQKARLTALGREQNRSGEVTGSLAQNCGAQAGVTDWPTDVIDRAINPTPAQRSQLDALKAAAERAADTLKSCPDDRALTPPARLEAVSSRLEVMLQAIKSVRSALVTFYNSLSDEQKAQFDSIGPQRAARG